MVLRRKGELSRTHEQLLALQARVLSLLRRAYEVPHVQCWSACRNESVPTRSCSLSAD